MFDELRKCLDRFEGLANCTLDYFEDDNKEFLNNLELYFAKAIKNELPNAKIISQILNILCEEV